MVLKGKAWKYKNNVNTDEIIPARYLNTTDLKELASHCMEDIDEQFVTRLNKGDIIAAGKNFGCGSSREHAPISIKACGVSCVIARNFARIFFRNAINIGLPILECAKADKIKSGHVLKVDLVKGEINNLTTKETYGCAPFPDFMQELVNAGGLVPWLKKSNK